LRMIVWLFSFTFIPHLSQSTAQYRINATTGKKTRPYMISPSWVDPWGWEIYMHLPLRQTIHCHLCRVWSTLVPVAHSAPATWKHLFEPGKINSNQVRVLCGAAFPIRTSRRNG
jgi:hypothetical protein